MRYQFQRSLLLFLFYFSLLTLHGCGYHIVGSTSLPFDKITILPVQNRTYEPNLEDLLHQALSTEFTSQGINVNPSGVSHSGVTLEAIIRSFSVNTIASSNEKVKEQSVTMEVDFRLRDGRRIMEFNSVRSPINITFQTAGSVTESVIEKQKALERITKEVARELISRIMLRYAE